MSDRPDWLSVSEALDVILENVTPLPVERVPLADALGRALAEDVVSSIAHPPWDNSAMDGFAVRHTEVEGASAERPVVLPISDDVPAGRFPSGPLRAGTAARVMTGAPTPQGATGVVRVEHTDGGRGDTVEIRSDADALRNIRRAAEDIVAGDVVVRTGDTVAPATVGVLAMVGRETVLVHRRPRVAVLANGDELVDFDGFAEVEAGRKIMNSNSHALAAQLRSIGAEPVLLGIARDSTASVRERLAAAEECDAIVSSAGVSVGDHDHVKEALDEAGFQRLFWRVRMRPGSPITFGLLGGRPFWGLPGNPVSAMVTFDVMLRPAILRLAGQTSVLRPGRMARAGERITTGPELTFFYRVTVEETDGPPVVRLTGPQGSGILTSMTAADALAVIPEGVSTIEVGEPVEILPLHDTSRT
jgi:molybdopterin molybdotransferase